MTKPAVVCGKTFLKFVERVLSHIKELMENSNNCSTEGDETFNGS